jgi:hypothetical protein
LTGKTKSPTTSLTYLIINICRGRREGRSEDGVGGVRKRREGGRRGRRGEGGSKKNERQ